MWADFAIDAVTMLIIDNVKDLPCAKCCESPLLSSQPPTKKGIARVPVPMRKLRLKELKLVAQGS